MIANVITICNKLNRIHSNIGLDVWYSHKLYDISYSIERVTTVNGSNTFVGEVFNILIPFSDDYLPYMQWKDSLEKDTKYTMNQGDYIFLGIDLSEQVTPNTIQQLRNSYKPNVCEVRSIMEVPKRQGINIQIQLKVSGV